MFEDPGIVRRVFAAETIERVQFIKQAQDLGFSLDEIKGVRATGGVEECQRVRDLLSQKLQELDGRLTSMKKFPGLEEVPGAGCREKLIEGNALWKKARSARV